MLSSYRALLGRAGARPLMIACAVSWLSYSGYGLAVVLTVQHTTRSFALAGVAVAVQSLGAGALAPFRGRLVDRRGSRALRHLAAGHVLAGAALLAGCASGRHALLLLGAALLGASSPPLIATARSLWTDIAGPQLAHTGHALNAALSDAAQVGSPALVAAVSLVISPTVALGILVLGVPVAAVLMSNEALMLKDPPRSTSRTGRDVWGVLRGSAGLRTLMASDLMTGAWLAGLEIAVTAVAASKGLAELGAVPLVASALGSIGMSLSAGGRPLPGVPAQRYLAGALVVAAALPMTLLASAIGEIAAVLFVVGAGVGLLNVALFELLDVVSPNDRRTEAFTWLTSASATGSALGASVSGRLAQVNVTASLLLVIAVAFLGLGIAVAWRRTLTPQRGVCMR